MPTRFPRLRAAHLRYRLHVAVAFLTLLLLGAYLRIVLALCAAYVWVKGRNSKPATRIAAWFLGALVLWARS